jgi:hypothetical protein
MLRNDNYLKAVHFVVGLVFIAEIGNKIILLFVISTSLLTRKICEVTDV